MSTNTSARCLASLILTVLLALPAVSQDGTLEDAIKKNGQKPLTARRYLVIKEGAELKTQKATVWKAYPGEVFEISLVNGEWLWSHERGGWLWAKHAVLLDNAVEQFSASIEKEPTAEAYNWRGLAHLALDEYGNATEDFTSAIEKQPTKAGLFINRGNAHRLADNPEKAISDYATAARIEPGNFVAYNNRGIVYQATKKYDAAIADFSTAIRLNKRYAEAWNNRGVARKEKQQFRESIMDYSQAISLDARYDAAFRNRGFALMKLRNYDRALADFSKAAILKPGNEKNLNEVAWLLATCPDERFRDGKKAVADAKNACRLTDSKNGNCLDTLAAAYAEIGEFKKAEETARLALEFADDERKPDVARRLQMYISKKPFRQ